MDQNDPENSQTRRSIKTNKISIEFVTFPMVFAGIFADITEDLMRDFAVKQGYAIDVREALYDFTTKAVFIVLTGKKPMPGDLRYEKAKVIERDSSLPLDQTTFKERCSTHSPSYVTLATRHSSKLKYTNLFVCMQLLGLNC
jgi:hypothetical protein